MRGLYRIELADVKALAVRYNYPVDEELARELERGARIVAGDIVPLYRAEHLCYIEIKEVRSVYGWEP